MDSLCGLMMTSVRSPADEPAGLVCFGRSAIGPSRTTISSRRSGAFFTASFGERTRLACWSRRPAATNFVAHSASAERPVLARVLGSWRRRDAAASTRDACAPRRRRSSARRLPDSCGQRDDVLGLGAGEELAVGTQLDEARVELVNFQRLRAGG